MHERKLWDADHPQVRGQVVPGRHSINHVGSHREPSGKEEVAIMDTTVATILKHLATQP
jgi:hypothetical protein